MEQGAHQEDRGHQQGACDVLDALLCGPAQHNLRFSSPAEQCTRGARSAGSKQGELWRSEQAQGCVPGS